MYQCSVVVVVILIRIVIVIGIVIGQTKMILHHIKHAGHAPHQHHTLRILQHHGHTQGLAPRIR